MGVRVPPGLPLPSNENGGPGGPPRRSWSKPGRSGDLLGDGDAEHQEDREDDQGDDEQEFGDAGGGACDAAEAQQARHDGDHCENQSPFQHCVLLWLKNDSRRTEFRRRWQMADKLSRGRTARMGGARPLPFGRPPPYMADLIAFGVFPMAYVARTDRPADKAARYHEVEAEIVAVLDGEPNVTARMATVASMLADAFDHYFWTGFYVVAPDKTDELVVGPYQGTLGCLRIAFGRGVCGAAAGLRQKTTTENNIFQNSFSNLIATQPLIILIK